MRVLVTGATGFLGRHLLPELAERHEVVALARRPVDGIETVVADLAGDFPVPDGLDAVVHLAQSRRYREWPEGAADVYAVNVNATFRLLGRAERFVLASTGGVYAPSSDPLDEDAPLAPTGFYPRSKLAAELLAGPYGAVILRPFFIYGPGQEGMLIASLATRVQAGDEVVVQGDPGIRITPIHVSDAVRAVVAAVELGRPATVNVAGAEAIALTELVQLLAELDGRDPRIRHAEDAGGDLVADIRRMRQLLGVTPAVSLRDGLAGVLAR